MAVVFCLLGLNSFFVVFERKDVSRCLLPIHRFQLCHNFELFHVSPSLPSLPSLSLSLSTLFERVYNVLTTFSLTQKKNDK